MNTTISSTLIVLAGAIGLQMPTAVLADEAMDRVRGIQLARLFEPTAYQIDSERRGRVQIYSGLYDYDVARAMDQHSERIGSMMFVGTKITDADNQPVIDSSTGEEVAEDDDC